MKTKISEASGCFFFFSLAVTLSLISAHDVSKIIIAAAFFL